MIVVNKRPRLHLIDVPSEQTRAVRAVWLAAEDKRIAAGDPKPTPEVIPTFDQIRLLPGVNEVDPSLWNLAKENPLIQFYIDEAILIEKDKGIDQLDAKPAVKLVVETFDRNLLRKWSDSENRPLVKNAIIEQLTKITPAPKKDA